MSIDAPAPPVPPHGVLRLLGADDLHGYLTPIWQSLVVGLAFVGISLLGYHDPIPRGVDVDITGPAAAVTAFGEALSARHPGGFTVYPVSSAEEGMHRLRSGDTYAVLDLGPSTDASDPAGSDAATMSYAGANGPTVTATLTQTFGTVLGARARELRTVDVVPLRTHDAAGLPLFYLVSGVVLASFLFTVGSVVVGAQLPLRGHWTSSALLALALGSLAVLFAHQVTNTIDSRAVEIALLLALASMATSTTTALLLHLSRTFGNVAATVVLVILGGASGGMLPGEFLPHWLAVLRPVLPLGAALSGIRELVYFGGRDLWAPVLILLTWAGMPIPLVVVIRRWRRLRPGSARRRLV